MVNQWTDLTKNIFCVVLLVVTLTGCGTTAAPATEVVVQPPEATPTLEPTFTASPPPAETPTPASTDTPTPEPTPTPVPQAGLSGLIFDQSTNQPIAEAQVSAGIVSTTTDTEGRYTLTDLPPGQYVLSVIHPDYDPGLSSIFTVATGEEPIVDVPLYEPDTSPYPEDPMLTNPLDPNGAPTVPDAERLAREQGLTGAVMSVRETRLSGEYLVNYKIGDDVRAAVAELQHDVWELIDDTGRKWWIIKVCGNLASPLPKEAPIATPAPKPLPPMAEVLVDGLVIRECTSEDCGEVGTVGRGERVEVFGCLVDGGWCEVGWSGGRGWCTGRSLRQLAVPHVVPVVSPPILGDLGTGEKVAFVSDRDGNDEIYVMNTDGGGLLRLTNHPDDDRYPNWSPDGKKIAFSRDGVYVMNLDGSSQTRLTEFGGCPAWSPDGRLIAFSHNQQLYIMNSDGSGLTRLGSNINCPTWLPDGRHISYFLLGTWVLRIDTNGQIRIVDGSGRQSPALDLDNRSGYINSEANMSDANGATWSRDGQWIAFQSYGRDDDYEIYRMNFDGSGLTRLTNYAGRDAQPTWSPDGQHITFTSERGDNEDIYMMNADGSGLMRLTEHPANDRYPAWLPTSVTIAAARAEAALPTATPGVAIVGQGKIVFTCTMYDYQVNDDGTFVTHPADGSKIFDIKKEICIINADGSDLTRLTYHNEQNYARDPAWSPNKNKVAFSDDGDIYLMNSDGSDLVNLTNSPDRTDSSPTWSPDGQQIAFCSGQKNVGGNEILYVVNIDGSSLTVLADECSFNPEWSPDGSKIALGSNGIQVVNISDGSVTQLTDNVGSSPSWSTDGQKIVYASSGSPNSSFFVMNVDGSGLTKITDFPASEYWPNWSPDGQRIVFHSNRHGIGWGFDLYIMNANGSDVIRLTEPQELNGGVTKLVDAGYPDW